MNVHDWALVVFTILSQMAVGSFVVLGLVHTYAMRKAGIEEADRLSDRALLVIGPVLALGMLASLLHLGSPINAYKAVGNLGTSWLSREILFGVIFAVLGALFALMQWRKIGTFALRNVLAWITALVGLAMIYSMSHIYMIPTQPTWDTVATPIFFFTTTFLLGMLAMGAAFVANYAYLRRKGEAALETQLALLRSVLQGIAVGSLLLLGVEVVLLPVFMAYLATYSPVTQASAEVLVDNYLPIFIVRLVLIFLGAGIFAAFLYRSASARATERTLANLVYAAFGLVLVAEVLGRFLFYAGRVTIGL